MGRCEECSEKTNFHWLGECMSCQKICLKENFTSWTSGYETIDNCIQDMQLKIEHHDEIVIEWIPYNQLSDIKEIGKGDFVTENSAIWKGGPLYYSYNKNELIRKSADENVVLKYSYDSQNLTNEFLNEV